MTPKPQADFSLMERVLYIQFAHPRVPAVPTTCKSLHAFVHTVELASARGGLYTYTFAMFVGVSMSAHVGLAHMCMCVQEGKARARACGLKSSGFLGPTGRGPCAQSFSQGCPREPAGPGQTNPASSLPGPLRFSCFLPEDPPGGRAALPSS